VPVWRASDRRNGVAKLATVTLIIGVFLGTSKADRAGGQFGFAHSNFTDAKSAMTAQQFVLVFDAAMHNPNVFRQWIRAGREAQSRRRLLKAHQTANNRQRTPKRRRPS
jgi:hypothetical protein